MASNAGSVPLTGPGGGGGGGGDVSGAGYNGAAGWPGQVELLYTASSTPNNVVVRFPLSIPSTGCVNNAVILSAAISSGSLTALNCYYQTGGKIGLKGVNGASTIFDSGAQSFGADGKPVMISMELSVSGTSLAWALRYVVPGGTTVTSATGSVASSTIGAVSGVTIAPAGTINDTAVGMVVVQYAYEDMVTSGLADALNGHDGETAGARFLRLCAEENIGGTLIGTAADTPKMGPQRNGKFTDLLQQIADADQGLIIEDRAALGLKYRTRASLSNQEYPVIFDYSQAQLAQQLTPTPDDQLTRNDVTVTRINGAANTVQQLSGPLSMQDPPDGVGDYTYSLNANLNNDGQVAPLAAWIIGKGTVDEQRYPAVFIDLTRHENQAQFNEVASMDGGDHFQIVNMPAFADNPTVDQLAFGFDETLNAFKWLFEFNAVPESPYETNYLTTGHSGSADNSDFENSIGTWVAVANCAIAQSNAHAYTGAQSLRMTSSAAGDMTAHHTIDNIGGVQSNGMLVSAGETIYISAWFLATTADRNCQVQIDFYNSAGTYLSTAVSPNFLEAGTNWTQAVMSYTLASNSTAAYAIAKACVKATAAASEVHYVDNVQMIGGWW